MKELNGNLKHTMPAKANLNIPCIVCGKLRGRHSNLEGRMCAEKEKGRR